MQSMKPANDNKSAASLHGEVLAQIRRMIFEGELKPGARIIERLLCERLKVSRTPLREAFKVLASEGLLDLLPNCGARVSALCEQDVRDALEVMGAIEGLAGELAATRASDDVIAEIRALHYQMLAHYLRRELPEYFQLNQAIHRRIVQAAGNALLTAQYDLVNLRVARARYVVNRIDEERWAHAMKEHEAILDCLTRRAGGELRELLRQHLMNKLSSLLEHFPKAEQTQESKKGKKSTTQAGPPAPASKTAATASAPSA
jgi:DNA-binding GntR family transcriptional regulator